MNLLGQAITSWHNAHAWRMRAEETRALAGEMNEAEPEAVMLSGGLQRQSSPQSAVCLLCRDGSRPAIVVTIL